MEINKTSKFTKSAKRLAKRYKKFTDDLITLNNELQNGVKTSIDLGDNFYKIRLKNSSNLSGKSGGFRVVYFLKTNENEIYLLDIYSKNDVSNISKDKLIQLAKASHLIQ